MSFRPLPVLTVLTLVSLVILIVLGNWQYDRYTHKMSANSPTNEPVIETTIEAIIDTANNGMAQQIYGAIDGEPVWRRYVPAHLDDGELVLVLWDATGGPQPVQLVIPDTATNFARIGSLVERPSKRGTFALKDNPENNLWHTPDAAKMAANLGYDVPSVRFLETLEVTIRNSSDLSQARRSTNPYAFEDVSDPLPPQRHFGYALTWWGMAIGLLAVYLAFHHSQGRLRFRS